MICWLPDKFCIQCLMKNQIIKFFFIKDYQFLVANINAASIYFFEINKGNKKLCEICSKLTIKKSPEHYRRSGIFIVNFKHISQIHLVIEFGFKERHDDGLVVTSEC